MDQSVQASAWQGHDTGNEPNVFDIPFRSEQGIAAAWVVITESLVWIDQDTTFEFERKRNRPDRYDRNVTEQTLKAIPLITKIRHERLKTHITERSVAVSLTPHFLLFSEWFRF